MNTIDQYENLKIKYDALKREAAHHKKLFKKSISELSREIDENVVMKLDLKNKNDLLVEKIKELNCLNEISIGSCDEDFNLNMFIIKVVSIIASTFRYPEYASVEIKVKDRLYHSENFVRTSLRLNQVLNSKKNIIGRISIFYNDEIAEINNSPFLNDAKQFLTTIAYNLGEIIYRNETNEELQKAKEKVEKNEKRFQSLSEATFQAIFFSENGVCVDQNVSAEKMFGYAIEEAIGKMGTDWIAPEDRGIVMNNMISGYKGLYEATALRKDGSKFPAELQGKMIHYNGKTVRVTALTDISDRKNAEQAIKESEKKYRLIFESFQDIYYRANNKGIITELSPSVLQISGFRPDELIGKPVTNVYQDPADRIYVQEALKKYGRLTDYELKLVTKDKKVRICSLSSQVTVGQDGETKDVEGIIRDITVRKQMEEKLRLAKEDYEHIAQNVPEAILIIGRDGSTLYANKMASELSGYSPSEILKLHLVDFIHPDDYDKVRLRLISRLTGHILEPRYETRIKIKNGETKTVLVSGSKTKWMCEMVSLVVINDITEKRRFESILKIQDEIDYLSSIPEVLNVSLKKIFDSLLEFDWIDGGGIYLNFVEGLKLVFHKGLSESFVKKNHFAPIGSGQYNLVMRAKNQYLMLDSLQVKTLHLIEEGISSLLIIPLTYDNEVIGSLNLATKNNMELSENEKMIFEAIGNRISQTIALIYVQEKLTLRNKDLRKSLKEIKEKQHLLIQKSKLESLGEMAAGIAHEINQPLGIMLLSLENILFKVSAKKATQKYLDDKFISIFYNIDKIKTIIDHIQTFSHDQKSLIIKRIDLNEVIRKACSLIKEQYKYHNITINLDLGEDVGYALGNNQKMEQVIFNLISNAKFALEEKESLPMVDSFDKEINIRTFSDSKKIYIELKDNGMGIEKENLPDIFNPFFTTKPEGVGTGLGLSIVYGIITEMKGAISIDSDRNEYTLVKIELLRYKLMP